jgi:hypothetical protein
LKGLDAKTQILRERIYPEKRQFTQWDCRQLNWPFHECIRSRMPSVEIGATNYPLIKPSHKKTPDWLAFLGSGKP